MTNNNSNESLIYPGDYVPLHNEEEITEGLKQPHEGDMVLPPVNLTEHEDYLKIEIAAPGLKREDFLIEAKENVLSVSVLHKECGGEAGKCFQVHEYNYECFRRHIILPLNAVVPFSTAEYKDGLLAIRIPKDGGGRNAAETKIAVY